MKSKKGEGTKIKADFRYRYIDWNKNDHGGLKKRPGKKNRADEIDQRGKIYRLQLSFLLSFL